MKNQKPIDENFETFVNSFMEAAAFSAEAENLEFTKKAQKLIRAKCEIFYHKASLILEKAAEYELFEDVYSQAGYDFYFTAAGDGVGFWETEWKPYSDQLYEIAEEFKTPNVSVWRKKLYIDFC